MGTLFAHLTPEPPKRPRRSLLFRHISADEQHLSSGRFRADKKPAHPKVIKAFADISAARRARRSAQVRAWNALMAVVINLPPSG